MQHHCSDVLKLWQGQLLLGLVEGKLCSKKIVGETLLHRFLLSGVRRMRGYYEA